MSVLKLRMKLLERKMSVTELSNRTGIKRDTLYRRMKDAGNFTIGEVEKIKDVLELDDQDASAIFFGK